MIFPEYWEKTWTNMFSLKSMVPTEVFRIANSCVPSAPTLSKPTCFSVKSTNASLFAADRPVVVSEGKRTARFVSDELGIMNAVTQNSAPMTITPRIVGKALGRRDFQNRGIRKTRWGCSSHDTIQSG